MFIETRLDTKRAAIENDRVLRSVATTAFRVANGSKHQAHESFMKGRRVIPLTVSLRA